MQHVQSAWGILRQLECFPAFYFLSIILFLQMFHHRCGLP